MVARHLWISIHFMPPLLLAPQQYSLLWSKICAQPVPVSHSQLTCMGHVPALKTIDSAQGKVELAAHAPMRHVWGE